jgi:putative thioredoxin
MDVTEDTFYRDVVERSHEHPIVVDFWAPWCGPCRALTPVLEQEIAVREGQVELVKVNVDDSPKLAAHYEVQGIPAVKAFRNGQVVSEFTGVRSAPGVAEFLDALLGPSAGEQLADELRESGEEPEVLAALEAGDHERALSFLLDEALDAEPDRRDRIRELMVAIFAELGQEHELSMTYRRRLASLLY